MRRERGRGDFVLKLFQMFKITDLFQMKDVFVYSGMGTWVNFLVMFKIF